MAALEKEFYTGKELAELLELNPMTIYRLAKTGDLDYYMIGNSMRFRRDDIEAYLTSRRNVGIEDKKLKTSKGRSKE